MGKSHSQCIAVYFQANDDNKCYCFVTDTSARGSFAQFGTQGLLSKLQHEIGGF